MNKKTIWRKYYDVKAAIEVLDAVTEMTDCTELIESVFSMQRNLDIYADILAKEGDE